MSDSICLTVLTGFEMANKYDVKNNMGQQVFYVAEGRSQLV